MQPSRVEAAKRGGCFRTCFRKFTGVLIGCRACEKDCLDWRTRSLRKSTEWRRTFNLPIKAEWPTNTKALSVKGCFQECCKRHSGPPTFQGTQDKWRLRTCHSRQSSQLFFLDSSRFLYKGIQIMAGLAGLAFSGPEGEIPWKSFASVLPFQSQGGKEANHW
jgi:hypothetical protein